MEFIKVGKNYMIKNSNGRIVSEKEKLELENRELIIEDIKSNKCQGKTTQRISKNKKKIKEIENKELKDFTMKVWKKEFEKNFITAQKGESADEIIEETDTII